MARRRAWVRGGLCLWGGGETRAAEIVKRLAAAFGEVRGVRLGGRVRGQLDRLIDDAVEHGAGVFGERGEEQRPLLVTHVDATMEIARADVFAPVLTVMRAETSDEAVAMVEACPYGLTAAVFGDEGEARAVAKRLTVGTVTINDVIVPTADARVPFGGRKMSGFGTTRGVEGLLEMTAAKTIAVRRGKGMGHYEAAGAQHEELFDGLILAQHGGSWAQRWSGVKRMVAAARTMKRDK